MLKKFYGTGRLLWKEAQPYEKEFAKYYIFLSLLNLIFSNDTFLLNNKIIKKEI